MGMRTNQVGSFMARDDDGREYTIHILTYTVSVGNKSDSNAEREGMTSSLRTSDGRAVNRRLVGQEAAPRDHALRDLPAGEPAAARYPPRRPAERSTTSSAGKMQKTSGKTSLTAIFLFPPSARGSGRRRGRIGGLRCLLDLSSHPLGQPFRHSPTRKRAGQPHRSSTAQTHTQ